MSLEQVRLGPVSFPLPQASHTLMIMTTRTNQYTSRAGGGTEKRGSYLEVKEQGVHFPA